MFGGASHVCTGLPSGKRFCSIQDSTFRGTSHSLKMPEHSTKRLSGMPPFFSMLYHDLITGLPTMHDLLDELRSEDAEAGLRCAQLFNPIYQASCNCPQVLDLGNTEIVASWDEGEIHYKEITTQPDYGR